MNGGTVRRTTCARIPTSEGEFQLCHYANDRDDKEHLAVVLGNVAGHDDVLVRVHSECFTGDVLGSLRCDCGPQLHRAMALIAQEGTGIILYLRQEGRGIGLQKKLEAYNLQDQGYDTVDANLQLGHQADEREYWAAAGILRDLGVRSIRLMTNNPSKIEHLQHLGIAIRSRVPLETGVTADNAGYLATKVQRMRHLLNLPPGMAATAPADLPPDLGQRIQQLATRAQLYAHEHGLPFVTLSYAQSLDGSIAAPSGRPLSISSAESMRVTHALRASHDAILVGIGTVMADDPRLTVRLVEGKNPQPIVLDSHLRLPMTSKLALDGRAWIAATEHDSPQRAKLEERGLRVLTLPAGPDRRVDLRALLGTLADLSIHSVMVEGGAAVLTSFLQAQLAQYAIVTLAPIFVGGAHAVRPLADGGSDESPALARFPRLDAFDVVRVGNDLTVWGELAWPRPQHAAGSGH